MVQLFGTDLFGEPVSQQMTGRLSEQFLVPPFSVISTRDGWWQERKRAWLSLGIKGEEGRKGDLLFGHFNRDYLSKFDDGGKDFDAVSVFDPVLCETIYRWFVADEGTIVDPFAGGSVRGIVAGCLGHAYWGCDLRHEQVNANNQQSALIRPESPPQWVCGDALATLSSAPDADLVFSCPPYGDLEQYSDNPNDLSNMEYKVFMEKYFRIIDLCFKKLKDDRFACFIVGDYRDTDGFYRNFVGETVSLFQAAGFKFYNDAILLNVVGTAAIRAARQFNGGRKLVKTHQNIIVFVKGNPKKAAQLIKETDHGATFRRPQERAGAEHTTEPGLSETGGGAGDSIDRPVDEIDGNEAVV